MNENIIVENENHVFHDAFGNVLNIGDRVVFTFGYDLHIGEVQKMVERHTLGRCRDNIRVGKYNLLYSYVYKCGGEVEKEFDSRLKKEN